MAYLLETKDLSKYYKNFKANDCISLQIKENTVYGLLGLNGAGKSTFLKMITGMIKPSEGEILFDGKGWERKDLKKIGSLIESPPLYNNLTAYENLKLRALLYDRKDSRIEEVLKLVNLENTGRKKAGKFSTGMKQQLGLAIALLKEPKLLVLDEPTNRIDPIGIGEFRSLIRRLKEEGMTIIVFTHILSEITQIADHIGIIVDGKLRYQDEITKEEELERLFVEVIKKAGEENA